VKHAIVLLLAVSLTWAGYGVEWTFSCPPGRPSIGLDVTQDGLPDVVVSFGYDSIRYYSGTTHAYLWSLANPHPGSYWSISIANTGGSSQPEIVSTSTRNTTSPIVYYGRFDIFDLGTRQVQFASPEFSSNYTYPWAYPYDLDGDGRAEICVISGDSTNFQLQVYGGTGAVQDPASGGHPARVALPSISTGSVLIDQFAGPVSVYDVAGRVIRLVLPGAASWDGRDQSGAPVPPGCYVIKAGPSAYRVQIIH